MMDKINEYDVITTSTEAELIKLVNERIKEGWRPLGGINTYVWSNEKDGATKNIFGRCQQAIVR